jgi:hypothetical protein
VALARRHSTAPGPDALQPERSSGAFILKRAYLSAIPARRHIRQLKL